MTHQIALDETNHSDSTAKLLLTGAMIDKNGSYADLFNQITKMQEALTAGRMEEYLDGFTEYGKKQTRDWFFEEKEESLRAQHIENFVTQEPFYGFNADPLFIVYTRSKSSGKIQKLYFVRQDEHRYKLANSAYATIIDTIFNNKKFLDAALEEEPFSSLKIH